METMTRRLRNLCWARLMLVVLCAAFTFGGSFTCSTSTHDDDEDENPPQTTNPPAPAATR